MRNLEECDKSRDFKFWHPLLNSESKIRSVRPERDAKIPHDITYVSHVIT